MDKKITDTKYDEYYAKKTLEKYFFDKYGNLDIIDKPDLQNKELKIGIEVTNAISADAKKLADLHVSEYRNEESRKKAIIKILGEKYLNNFKKHLDWERKYYPDLYIPEFDLEHMPLIQNNSFELIQNSIKNKLEKLNYKGYDIFEENNIFIFSHILACDEMLDSALQDIKDIQSNYKIKFNNVYVLVPSHLYLFDMSQMKYSTINISSEEQFTFAHTIYNELK